MKLKKAAEAAFRAALPSVRQGRVASYIPELAKSDPSKLGLCIYSSDHQKICIGDVSQRFTIQSICKVISLALALQHFGFERVFSHVGMEPSGDAFNSIIKLDTTSNLPFNPMINCGAIEVASILSNVFTFDQMLEYARTLCMDPSIVLDEKVYDSERNTGDRNRAIAYLLSSKGVLAGKEAESLDLYFKLCSLSVTTQSLAGLGLTLSTGGIDPYTGQRLLSRRIVRTIKALMFTCGMYDGSGEFAVKVGLPAKSGVGGGIVTCTNNGLGIGCYGPALDSKGNSIGGIQILQSLSESLNLHIMDSEKNNFA